jgi:hypothetical protein
MECLSFLKEECEYEDEDEYIFWFVAIKHDQVNNYIKDLEKYIKTNEKYIVGLETAKGVHKETNGEHIHVAATMSVNRYNKLHDAIHKKKMKLQLKAANGVGKQVGRVKVVRDQERALRYCCKDRQTIYKNITKQTIEKYIAESFQKGETWEDQIITKLKLDIDITHIDFNNIDNIQMDIELAIIDFYRNNSKQKAVPSGAYIKKLMLRFLMYECGDIDNKIIRYLI